MSHKDGRCTLEAFPGFRCTRPYHENVPGSPCALVPYWWNFRGRWWMRERWRAR